MVDFESGAALFGRTRRMILERDTDMYSTEDVHPLWHAWLNHRLEQPPTPEVCICFVHLIQMDVVSISQAVSSQEVEAYRRHQQKVSQNVAAMLESQKQAQHVLIQSQAPVAEPEEEKLTLTPARSGRSVTIPSSTPSSESDTLPRGSAAAVKLRSDRETDSSSLHSPWRSEDREQSTVSGQLTDTASSPADLSRPPADGLGVSLNSVLQSDGTCLKFYLCL